MTTPSGRRLLAAAPLLALALAAAGLGRKEVVALAREKFPAVMNRSEPARFLVMVFDSTDRYLWGFAVKGGVMFNVGGDTLTVQEHRALQAGGRIAPSSSKRTLHPYLFSVPAYVRDSTRALHALPMNAEDGLIPTMPRSDESDRRPVRARHQIHRSVRVVSR